MNATPVLSAVLSVLLQLSTVHAAEFAMSEEILIRSAVYFNHWGEAEATQAPPCIATMTGIIETGDLQKLKALRLDRLQRKTFWDDHYQDRSPGRTHITLCLNSDGGNFVEAIKIADHLISEGIVTRIDAGARCLSACAWIFLGGTWLRITDTWEDQRYVARYLHVTGKLGLHGKHPAKAAGDRRLTVHRRRDARSDQAAARGTAACSRAAFQFQGNSASICLTG